MADKTNTSAKNPVTGYVQESPVTVVLLLIAALKALGVELPEIDESQVVYWISGLALAINTIQRNAVKIPGLIVKVKAYFRSIKDAFKNS